MTNGKYLSKFCDSLGPSSLGLTNRESRPMGTECYHRILETLMQVLSL